MGSFINIGNSGFQSVLNGVYVDKTELISSINNTFWPVMRCCSAGSTAKAS